MSVLHHLWYNAFRCIVCLSLLSHYQIILIEYQLALGTIGSSLMDIQADEKEGSLILLKQGAEAVSAVTI